MEQITREEIVELLREHQQLLVRHGHPLREVIRAENAIAALQAAEPVAWIEIRDCDCEECEGEQDVTTDPLWSKHYPDKWTPLFTLPCPSAKAQVPDERKEPSTGDKWDKGYCFGWNDCRAEMLDMLTASPAPEHSEDKLGMVEALHEIAHSANRTATERQFSKYLQTIAADALAKVSDHAGEKTARQAVLDEAFEAVRKQLCRLPRYSFHAKSDGGTRRTEDDYGNWIEFDAVHALFDPVVVDAALTTHSEQEEAEPVAQHRYPCGCVTCICEDDEQCQGCGATTCDDYRGPSCGCTHQQEEAER